MLAWSMGNVDKTSFLTITKRQIFIVCGCSFRHVDLFIDPKEKEANVEGTIGAPLGTAKD